MAPAPAIRNFMVAHSSRLATLIVHERSSNSAAANFSSGSRRNTLHQINLLRTFVLRQQFAAMFDERRFSRAMRFVQHHGCSYLFTERGMSAAKGNRRRDCGMTQKNLIYFVRRNVFTAANDDVFDAARQVQVTIVVEIALVSGAKPSVHKSAGVCIGIVFISPKNIRALNSDFAALIVFERITLLVHDP